MIRSTPVGVALTALVAVAAVVVVGRLDPATEIVCRPTAQVSVESSTTPTGTAPWPGAIATTPAAEPTAAAEECRRADEPPADEPPGGEQP
jgi:hypothetical protein